MIETHYLREDRERGIVNHDFACIILALIVAVVVEWAAECITLPPVLFGDEIRDNLIYIIRCIAVICCQLGFEFLNKIIVVSL